MTMEECVNVGVCPFGMSPLIWSHFWDARCGLGKRRVMTAISTISVSIVEEVRDVASTFIWSGAIRTPTTTVVREGGVYLTYCNKAMSCKYERQALSSEAYQTKRVQNSAFLKKTNHRNSTFYTHYTPTKATNRKGPFGKRRP